MTTDVEVRELRPVDPKTGQALPLRKQPGYYPGFETLSQQSFWDSTTRQVVLDRVDQVPPIRFFTDEQAELLKIVCDRIIPQDDREESRRIPIVPMIDARLAEGKSDGYRYEHMPPDPDAHRLGLQAIEEMAQQAHGKSFAALSVRLQEELLQSIHDAKPIGHSEVWKQMPIHRFWMLLLTDCIDAYYAHPWAWDEIGFGGPAYPRAYMRLEGGEPEPWEVQEKRYEWGAPPDSISGEFSAVAGDYEHRGQSGQGGTH